MNTLVVLYAGCLSEEAFVPLVDGKNSVILTLEQTGKLNAGKTVICADETSRLTVKLEETISLDGHFKDIILEKKQSWTVKSLLETIAVHQEGCEITCFTWLDCPFLDPELACRLAERHLKYRAEYSYADGWPYGVAPEFLSPGTAAILAKIIGDDSKAVQRDALFWAIQKDINAFDIETEISKKDFRMHRLNLCADSKRNLLLLKRFIDESRSSPDGDLSVPAASAIEEIITEKPEILRTLPNFFPVQVFSGCPQACRICPYPAAAGDVTRNDFMDVQKFGILLDKIIAFSGDAVIDLSLWGELSLHPHKMKLIQLVLERPSLALIIETCGIGWKDNELEQAANFARSAAVNAARVNPLPPLSWIISLDSLDAQRYSEIRGAGFGEALGCTKKLLSLFPHDAYVQAVRTSGAEDDIEKFYRSWKETLDARNIIIQKYDDFCGFLPHLQASDISPVNRQSCWHLMRDMPVLIDGTVPLCRENIQILSKVMKSETLSGNELVLGNIFTDEIENIWERSNELYKQQCNKKYDGICAECDEYYTFNF